MLVAVAEARSFVRAGEVLGLSPSGVSRAVARLEARVGVRLFDRSSRSVTLSEEGLRFRDRVVPLLEAMEEAATELTGSAAAVRGRLRASIDPWFARTVLASALPDFLTAYPDVIVEIATSNHREEMMAGVDVAVRFGPPDVSSLSALRLGEVPVITVASPAYLRLRGEPQTPQDLARHDAILFRDPQTGRPFAWEYTDGNQAFEADVLGRLTFDDPTVAIEACVAGYGLLQGLALGLEVRLRTGELAEVLAGWSGERWPLYAYRISRANPPARVSAFLRFLRDVLRSEKVATKVR